MFVGFSFIDPFIHRSYIYYLFTSMLDNILVSRAPASQASRAQCHTGRNAFHPIS